MDKNARAILYGMAIGDGGVYLSKDQSSKTARMIIGHGPKQLGYLHHKAKLLHSILGGKEPPVFMLIIRCTKTTSILDKCTEFYTLKG